MTTTARHTTCAKGEQRICGSATPMRVRYYRGMLLDEHDLSAEQTYQNAQRRKLARLMHGCGILCGLKLGVSEDRCKRPQLVIDAGVALDGEGRLLEVAEPVSIPLAKLCKGARPNDECCEGETEDVAPGERTLCVILAHQERETEHEGAYVPGDEGCRQSREASRVAEGWCVELRVVADDAQDCPKHTCCTPRDAKPTEEELCKLVQALCEQPEDASCCKACCEVVLGRIRVDPACEELELVLESDGPFRRYAWTARRLDQLVAVLCAVGCPSPAKPLADASAEPLANVPAKEGDKEKPGTTPKGKGKNPA